MIRSIFVAGQSSLRSWQPDDPTSFAETISLDIGERRNGGADTFSIRVATPKGLMALEAQEGVVATRPLLVVDRYDLEALMQWLTRTVERCARDAWTESVAELRRYFAWEYDDYTVR